MISRIFKETHKQTHIYTCAVMEDPVVAADGHTYERKAIEKWLSENHTSPLRIPMPSKLLTPNFLVKSMIVTWKGSEEGRHTHASIHTDI